MENLVRQFVAITASKGVMFTAHDVFCDMTNANIDITYENVKSIINYLFNNNLIPGYKRTLVNSANVSPVPWIYHLETDDPSKYKKFITDEKTCRVDARKTLCVPNQYIRSINLMSGDIVYISHDMQQNCLILSQKLEPDTNHYKVDRNDNVRITQSCLKNYGYNGTEYAFQTENDCVKIKKVS